MSAEDEFQSLLSEARIVFEQGDLHGSLRLCHEALKIKECPKLLKKIRRIKEYIASQEKENLEEEKPEEELALHLYDEACQNIESGNLSEALKLLKESQQCLPREKTAKKIVKVEKALEKLEQQAPERPSESNKSLHPEDVNPEQMIEEARQLYHEGKLRQCLKLLYDVQRIAPSDKIQRKIERIETYMEQNGEEHSEYRTESAILKESVTIAEGFSLPRNLCERLYPYQQEGVKWLWKLHNTAPGGVLADDMGLGKTVQVISFLCGLFLSDRNSFTALVAMPVSVLVTWESELKRWAPALRVSVFHDGTRQTRLRQLAAVQRQGGVLLTTYGMITSSWVDLTTNLNADQQYLSTVSRTAPEDRAGPEFHWNYLVLDEAHKIKNPAAKTTKAIMSISAKHRILLTGTAVQNNLRELWSLYNCTHSGRLLGRMQTFQTEYEKPIMRSREKDASRAERAHGILMAQSLRKLIDPYFLRRTKAEVLPSSAGNPSDELEASMSKLAGLKLTDQMPKKTEVVIWLYLREIQERSYRDFLQLDQIKELLLQGNRRSPLMELVILKKLCDHPRLLSRDQCLSLNLEVNQSPGERSSKHNLPSAPQLMEESGKLYFLSVLMNSFLRDAEQRSPYPPRTLIFSQSLRLLDMAEKVILALNKRPENVAQSRYHRVLRLDGRLSKVEERLEVIRRFENDKSYTVMLLTTQVGGVGLTLTAANRVIILDPSWNPATDAQAVDRAYRIGQKSNVLVYRLITCATVEEKIYRRQIFKDSVIRQTTGSGRNKADHDPYRYFTRQDLRELFTLSDPRVSTTQEQLSQLHEAMDKWEDQWLAPHLNYLTGTEMRDHVFGLSFHDLMFSRQETSEPVHPATVDEAKREQELLRNRMTAAEFAIARECAGAKVSESVPPSRTETAYRPHDGVFLVPSKVESQRPMFNRPRLGLTKPTLSQTTIPWATQPTGPSSQPDGIIDLTDQLTSSLREMSISQANTPPRRSNNSIDQSGSPLVVVLSDAEGSPYKSQATDQCETESPSGGGDACQNTSVKSNHLDPSVTSERDVQLSSSSSAPTSKVASGHRPLSLDSPLPSSTTFLGAFKGNLHRSTPVSLRTAPQPMTPGTPLTNEKKSSLLSTPGSKSHIPTEVNNPPRESQVPDSPGASTTSSAALSPQASPPTENEDVLMDITAAIDDEHLYQTVNMKSVHEILARSGLVTRTDETDEAESPESPCTPREELAVQDSCLSASPNHISRMQQSVVDDSFDDLEIIGDSLDE